LLIPAKDHAPLAFVNVSAPSVNGWFCGVD
jgi:hypothetical protein